MLLSLTCLPNRGFLLPVSEIKESLREDEGRCQRGKDSCREQESPWVGVFQHWCDRHCQEAAAELPALLDFLVGSEGSRD